jgi:hypothetical protein
MPDFLYLFRSDEAARREAMSTPEKAQRSLEAWLRWIRELDANGQLKNSGQPLEPSGKVVRKALVSDGPYVEAKDVVLGYLLVSARDLAQAVELAQGCPLVAGGGSVEVRPVSELQP